MVKKTGLDDYLIKNHITLRVGYVQIEPGSDTISRVRLAIEKNNQEVGLEGLEDNLNPEILDSGKVEAFLRKLPTLQNEALNKLQDRVLYLNAPTLSLGITTSLTAEIIEKGYSLTVPSVAVGGIVQPTLNAPVDKTRAQDLIKRAREASSLFNQRVEGLELALANLHDDSEERGRLLSKLSHGKWQRFAVSIVWRDNSIALAKDEPENQQFKKEAEKAKEAALRYVSPPWTGMPKPE